MLFVVHIGWRSTMHDDIDISPPLEKKLSMKIGGNSLTIPAGTSRIVVVEYSLRTNASRNIGLYYRDGASSGLGVEYASREELDLLRKRIGKYGK